jgi:ABC-2 type transport system permease protein
MSRWISVFKYELRQTFVRKGYIFMTFIVPLLAVAAFYGYRAYKDTTEDHQDEPLNPVTSEEFGQADKTIAYVDLTPNHLFPGPLTYAEIDCQPNVTEISAEVIKQVTSPYCWSDRILYYDSRKVGEQALDDKTIDVLYVIEPDYVTSGEVSMYMSGFNIEAASTDQWMEDYLRASLLDGLDAESYERVYLRLRDPAVVTEHRIDEAATTSSNENQNFVLVYGFGLILMMSIFWGGGYLMQSVVQEKESRIIEIVLSSVQPLPLLVGKILAMGVLSLLQVGMLVGSFLFIASQAGDVSSALGDIEVEPVTLVLMIIYFLLGFLLFGSLMAAIGAVSSSVRESQNFVVVVSLPAAIPFFFLTLFAEEPNGTLAKALSLFPITAPLSMAMRLSVADVPVVQIGLSLVLLIAGVVFAIWLAARLFRVNTLLMGNTPKLRDIPKLLRG